MKRITALILAAAMIMTMLTACGAKKPIDTDENHHILYFKDKNKSENAVATFFNSDSEESQDIPMIKVAEDDDSFTFVCEGNCADYNMAYVTCGSMHTKTFAFNKCVSGWYNSDLGFLPYTQGEEIDYYPEFDDIELPFNGCNKTIHVWTPDDYNPNSMERYAVIYALDSPWMVNLGKKGQNPKDCCNLTIQAKSMMETIGYRTIIVAIDTFGDMTACSRDDELVPDIGATPSEPMHKQMLGNELSDFISGTVVPYIKDNYNVYHDPLHTSIAGISFSGLEAFYITMEHPEQFGTVGAFSPSFHMYDDNSWRSYLEKKNFNGEMPFIYLYTGEEGGDTDPYVTQMYDRLLEMDYPKKKITLHYNEWGMHTDTYWTGVFPEFLEAMVYRYVEPLQK